MIHFKPSEYVRPLPALQIVPLIDILLVNLSFFMAMFLYFNFEQQLNISVPQATASREATPLSEEIVINVVKEGNVVVNQKPLNLPQLGALLRKTADLNPGQAVVIRADQKTYHEVVVHVLDVCAKSKIWNISFATTRET